jgi:hypothetical protein
LFVGDAEISIFLFKLQNKKCKLAVGRLDNIVARGTVFEETGDDEIIHNIPLGKGNVRVSVDIAIKKDALLPVPIPGEVTAVRDAIGYHLEWPKQFVLVDEV